MMVVHYYRLILIFLVFISCGRLETGKAYFSEKDFLTDGSPAAGFEFLHVLQGDEVEDYDKKYTIKLPDGLKDKKIAWSFLYFTGLKKRSTYPHIFFLLANYDSSKSQIVLDKNGNLDFSDDSLEQIEKGKWLVTEVRNQKDKKAKAFFRLLYRNDVQDTFYKKLHAGISAEEKDLLPYNFMVFEQRSNCRKINLPDSNVVTLVDATFNGFFNDKNDKIIAGDVINNRVYNNPVKSKPAKAGQILPFQNTAYRIEEVDRYGNKIGLTDLGATIDTAEIIPSFGFIDQEGAYKRFEISPSSKFTVLYVWGVWCIGCHVQAPALVKVMEKYKHLSDLITLNSGDKEDVMMNYINSKKYPFQPYRLSYRDVQKLNIESFPTFLVLDKNKRIVLRTSNVERVNSFFENEM